MYGSGLDLKVAGAIATSLSKWPACQSARIAGGLIVSELLTIRTNIALLIQVTTPYLSIVFFVRVPNANTF